MSVWQGRSRERLLEEVTQEAQKGSEGTGAGPCRQREHPGEGGAAPIPASSSAPHLEHELTVNCHPVEPAGFAHLIAHHTLKLG